MVNAACWRRCCRRLLLCCRRLLLCCRELLHHLPLPPVVLKCEPDAFPLVRVLALARLVLLALVLLPNVTSDKRPTSDSIHSAGSRHKVVKALSDT